MADQVTSCTCEHTTSIFKAMYVGYGCFDLIIITLPPRLGAAVELGC